MGEAEMSLRVPGDQAYALVIRTALGGVAFLKNLDVDAMDDLRTAADEACDCLLHQGRAVEALEVGVFDGGKRLTVSLRAKFTGAKRADCAEDTAVSQAILETLVPEVSFAHAPCGCVERIDLTLPKAV